jgi:hypothetical protein
MTTKEQATAETRTTADPLSGMTKRRASATTRRASATTRRASATISTANVTTRKATATARNTEARTSEIKCGCGLVGGGHLEFE